MTTIRLRIRPIPGNPQAGFEVELTSELKRVEVTGAHLPPLPADLNQSLESWKSAYRGQEEVRSYDASRIGGGTIYTPPSASEVRNLVDSLRQQFNDWLDSGDPKWRKIRETLIWLVGFASDETHLVLDFRNASDLRRLPWQEWSLFEEHYPHAEVALRISDADGSTSQPVRSYARRSKIRILVVIGESTGINTQADLDSVTRLQLKDSYRAEVIPLVQPKPRELQEALCDAKGYDLFIFVGHSRSHDDGTVGWLRLNSQDEIGIQDFRFALKEAIAKGLKLVVFNSCDGLGLAKQLADLNLPQSVVMKEPVPDRVAIEFLDRFLHQFAERSQPLLTSIRIARQELEHFNFRYPNVTWLPTICVKSHVEPLTWRSLTDTLLPGESGHKQPPDKPPRSSTQEKSHISTRIIRLPRPVKLLMLVLLGLLVALSLWMVHREPVSPPEPIVVLPPAEMLVSAGDTRIYGSIKLSGNYERLKQDGIDAFKNGKYDLAAGYFSQIRKDAISANRNDEAVFAALKDPEVLIYENNAQARFNSATKKEPLYTIAAAVPLSNASGELFKNGQQLLFGIAQMQDKAVKSQQINLQVVIANDLNVPEEARAVAEKLASLKIDEQQILAVVGHYISDSTCEALPVYEQHHLVVVSPSSTLTSLRERCGTSNVFFRTTSSGAVEAKTLVNHLQQYLQEEQKSEAQVAVFYHPGDRYSDDVYAQIKNELSKVDVTVNVKAVVDLSDSNFDPVQELDQLGGVDALFLLPDGANENRIAYDNAIRLLKVSQQQKKILGSNPLLQQEVIKDGGGLANLQNKLVVASDWDWECALPEFKEDVAEKYWFGGVNRLTALSYEAVQVLLTTLTSGVTSDQIRDRLADVANVKSEVFLDKTISFDGNGDRAEIDSRLLVTPSGDPANPSFALLNGPSCPQH